jgi:hypothetical protein
MTVQLELKPEVESTLADLARAQGISLSEYLQRVVEDLARPAAVPAQDPESFERALDRLAEMGRDLPSLPSSAFTRESIYRDHD